MRALRIVLYSIGCGIFLTLYSQVQDLLRYAFSLAALFTGIHFFRSFDALGSRIAFIALVVVWYFLFNIIYVMLAQIYGWKTFLGP